MASQHSASSNREEMQGSMEEKVLQPAKIQATEVVAFAEAINLLGEISDRITERHEEFVGSSSGSSAQSSAGASLTSARDEMLASLPPAPVMQKKLEKHIAKEIKQLQREAKKVALVKQKGWAWELNQIFARIRRLSSLARQILKASTDVIRKFYILVFIDRQALGQNSRSARPA